jgi:hypothetical protein
MPEVARAGYAGLGEHRSHPMPELIVKVDAGELTFLAPLAEGHYRMFVFVRDEHGNAATANIPFCVAPWRRGPSSCRIPLAKQSLNRLDHDDVVNWFGRRPCFLVIFALAFGEDLSNPLKFGGLHRLVLLNGPHANAFAGVKQFAILQVTSQFSPEGPMRRGIVRCIIFVSRKSPAEAFRDSRPT